MSTNVFNSTLQVIILFPTELYSYTEESEFKLNREAFEITVYSQGIDGKIIINIGNMSILYVMIYWSWLIIHL